MPLTKKEKKDEFLKILVSMEWPQGNSLLEFFYKKSKWKEAITYACIMRRGIMSGDKELWELGRRELIALLKRKRK